MRRHRRLRRRLIGVPERPRLCVTKTDKHMYAQVIDDWAGRTLAAASTRDSGVVATITNKDGSKSGKLAEALSGEKMREVTLERGGNVKHGCHSGCVIQCSGIYNDAQGKYLSKQAEYERGWRVPPTSLLLYTAGLRAGMRSQGRRSVVPAV